eukprot:7380625-Prymnesium_polylepis.2
MRSETHAHTLTPEPRDAQSVTTLVPERHALPRRVCAQLYAQTRVPARPPHAHAVARDNFGRFVKLEPFHYENGHMEKSTYKYKEPIKSLSTHRCAHKRTRAPHTTPAILQSSGLSRIASLNRH